MKNTRLMAAIAAVIAGALASAGAHAQTTPLEVWQPSQRVEMDPAKRLPTTPSAPTTEVASQTMAPQSAAAYRQPDSAAAPAPVHHEEDRGGFFLGVQGAGLNFRPATPFLPFLSSCVV